jgi:predicted amidohydrolase YtcJ
MNMSDKEKLLIYNGRIFASNPQQPYAGAMIVSDGRIEWIGDEQEANVGRGVKKIDLQGKRVIPGLIDPSAPALFGPNGEANRLFTAGDPLD